MAVYSGMAKAVTATVFIPTYNGEPYIRDLLTMVFSQKVSFPYDVLIIDSGSIDATLDIIKEFPKVRLHQIPNSEFGHGRTRNLAASMSRSEFMVYLSQDAVPAHERWLELMLEPFFIDKRIVGVVGKQIPRPYCDISTKREVSGVFNTLGPDHAIMIHRKNSLITNEEVVPYLTFFSDVNSAVRRDFITKTIPYRDVKYSEDQFLGSDILENDYLKAYSSQGAVFHSNEYSIRDYFYRKHDEYMGMYETLGVVPPRSIKLRVKRVIGDTLRDLWATFRDKDYTAKRKVFNAVTCWIRNIEKEYAAHLVSKDEHREKVGQKYSLEARNKKV